MDFSEALIQVKQGNKVERAGWNGKGQWVHLRRQEPPYLPYIEINTVQQTRVPWLASQTDILADDWAVVP